ncbi:hypothetical protein PR048_008499 [Dryococelus australis]|uniref:Uncharacterized protein n=1 Tax=Dryococelus australis TaxID=614101 RepID=A0ABQ9HX98_9NEOP|nr:hypothetical protein PR048_008499 [Dryococelus australis]
MKCASRITQTCLIGDVLRRTCRPGMRMGVILLEYDPRSVLREGYDFSVHNLPDVAVAVNVPTIPSCRNRLRCSIAPQNITPIVRAVQRCKNTFWKVAFTSTWLKEFATIIVIQVEAGLVPKHNMLPLCTSMDVFVNIGMPTSKRKFMHAVLCEADAVELWEQTCHTCCIVPTLCQHSRRSWTDLHRYADEVSVIPVVSSHFADQYRVFDSSCSLQSNVSTLAALSWHYATHEKQLRLVKQFAFDSWLPFALPKWTIGLYYSSTIKEPIFGCGGSLKQTESSFWSVATFSVAVAAKTLALRFYGDGQTDVLSRLQDVVSSVPSISLSGPWFVPTGAAKRRGAAERIPVDELSRCRGRIAHHLSRKTYTNMETDVTDDSKEQSSINDNAPTPGVGEMILLLIGGYSTASGVEFPVLAVDLLSEATLALGSRPSPAPHFALSSYAECRVRAVVSCLSGLRDSGIISSALFVVEARSCRKYGNVPYFVLKVLSSVSHYTSHDYTTRGVTVAERLACSPATKVNRVQSPAGSPDLRK